MFLFRPSSADKLNQTNLILLYFLVGVRAQVMPIYWMLIISTQSLHLEDWRSMISLFLFSFRIHLILKKGLMIEIIAYLPFNDRCLIPGKIGLVCWFPREVIQFFSLGRLAQQSFLLLSLVLETKFSKYFYFTITLIICVQVKNGM